MQSTTVVNAQTLSTSGPAQFPVKTTLQATSAALQIHCRLTPGTASQQGSRQKVKVFAAVSPFDITAELGTGMKIFAEAVEIPAYNENGRDVFNVSSIMTVLGAYLYTWVEVPAFVPGEPVLTVIVNELN